MKLNINHKLALAAFILSVSALGVSVFSGDTSSAKNEDEPQYITVLELAEQIKNREDFLLIDLRSLSDYNQFNIPTAKHLPIAELYDFNTEMEVQLIVYAEADSLSSLAFSVLKDKGFENMLVLKGGIQDWYNRLLYPKMPLTIPEEDIEIANHVKELSAYFGGRSQFVDEGNPLEYYKSTSSNQPKIKSQLVRMGC
ncbi:MAG: rhodanese-like domain-containing protein [Balneolaceae bacterium]|nr:rhodanese-like domain-containing protein [Balneolaceae bacterium]MBO6545232.1 rhodanese-like domain-containing protein [Balneolaceae bacterium]MBO6646628.1 rhodanese-like domain-containing protein [Balneolaceae bacterium]